MWGDEKLSAEPYNVRGGTICARECACLITHFQNNFHGFPSLGCLKGLRSLGEGKSLGNQRRNLDCILLQYPQGRLKGPAPRSYKRYLMYDQWSQV